MTNSEIIQIVLSGISVLVAIVIGRTQYLQDKRVNKQMNALREAELENKIDKFIIENDDEIDYLPLCYIANQFKLHHKYNREIYNNYNFLKPEEQDYLLKKLKYNFKKTDNKNWFTDGIKLIHEFIIDKNLGKDYLNDNGKYLKLALEYSNQQYSVEKENELFINDVFNMHKLALFKDTPIYGKISYRDYFFEYYRIVIINKDKITKLVNKLIPPLDLIDYSKKLGDCDELDLIFWVMNSTQYILTSMIGDRINLDEEILEVGDARIETYEDKFLSVLIDIYNIVALRR